MKYFKKYKKLLESPEMEKWFYIMKIENSAFTNLKAEDVFAEIIAGISKESNVNAELIQEEAVIQGGFFVFLTFINKEKIILIFKSKIENLITKGFLREFDMELIDGNLRTGRLTMTSIISDGKGIYDKLNKVIGDEIENPDDLFEIRIKDFGDIKDKMSGKRH